ncbi:MAG: transporter [Paludibacteraceae bacterium]|nr:transporter [Paludibacteraceae bacterium]
MKKTVLTCTAMLMGLTGAIAGGLNTNTNQSAEYLRNPARDGAIGIDGVYSNPAGVAFLDSGLHVSFNIQSAQQQRNIVSTFPAFAYGAKNGKNMTKTFEGEASAPLVPSLQAAYNWNGWSFQLNTAVTGGGGKCEFSDGLGSFESNVALLNAFGAKKGFFGNGYYADMYMKGRQYYIGITLGAAKKVTDNLSVYLGARALYGNSSYKGHVKNIMFMDPNSNKLAKASAIAATYNEMAEGYQKKLDQLKDAGLGESDNAKQLAEGIAKLKTAAAASQKVGSVTDEDVVLDCDQYGWGIAPIIGLDYKINKWNFSTRYEFNTRMRLKNDAVNSKSAANFSALKKFEDGKKVEEDLPALFTVGLQYELLDNLRLMGGFHLFFDKQAKQYNDRQDLLDGNTTEYLLGLEWDICKHLQFSIGGHRTHFCNTDEYISDMSYNVSNWDLGTGFGIPVNDRLKLNLSFYKSFYDNYTRTTNDYNNLSTTVAALAGTDAAKQLKEAGSLFGQDKFERNNYAFGIGVNYRF